MVKHRSKNSGYSSNRISSKTNRYFSNLNSQLNLFEGQALFVRLVNLMDLYKYYLPNTWSMK